SCPSLTHLADDVISAGFVALTEAVQRLATAAPAERQNATGYLSVAIDGAFKTVSDAPVSIPPRSRWRAHSRGQVIAQAIEQPADDESSECSYDPSSMRDLRDQLD